MKTPDILNFYGMLIEISWLNIHMLKLWQEWKEENQLCVVFDLDYIINYKLNSSNFPGYFCDYLQNFLFIIAAKKRKSEPCSLSSYGVA